MFHGSIPVEVRSILHEHVLRWNAEDVFVGCSGNFTVERVLSPLNRFRLHGCDVTLYSSILGAFFAGIPFSIALRDRFEDSFGWLREYMTTPADAAATVMLCTRMLDGVRADGTLKHNPYYDRMTAAYRKQFPALHRKTAERLSSSSLKLATYTAGDLNDWITTLPANAAFICYPPFFSGDYEAQSRKLDQVFVWDKPAYKEIGGGQFDGFLAQATERDYWMLGFNHLRPELEAFLCGMTKTTNRGVPVYLYASRHSNAPKRVVTPAQVLEPVKSPRLAPGGRVGDHMTLERLTQGQFQALRSEYMNVGIKPGQPSEAIGVFVDGVLMGAFAFSVAPSKARISASGSIYLLSDFPVAPSDYPRLSKLVLYAALSRASQLLAERIARRRVRRLFTTAFSNNPVSMKYRGLFELHSRTENPAWDAAHQDDPDQYYQQRYMMNYVAPIGQWTLDEGLEIWKKKHGKTDSRSPADA